MRPLHVLSVGSDHHLMEVRSMLLRDSGYKVEEAYSADEAAARLESQEFDLLLICHTVVIADRKRLIAQGRSKEKPLQAICLFAREADAVPGCVNVENSPGPLLAAMAAVAGQPAQSSKAQLRMPQS